jgi:hypothetical protein
MTNSIPNYIRRNAQRQGYARVWCKCGRCFDNRAKFDKHLPKVEDLSKPRKHGPVSMIEARFNADFAKMMES